jgi:uncharacterized protein YcgI (DUF1989 family)
MPAHRHLVRLRASTDLIVIMSACPQDLLPVNGLEQQPTNVHFRVHAADRAALAELPMSPAGCR